MSLGRNPWSRGTIVSKPDRQTASPLKGGPVLDDAQLVKRAAGSDLDAMRVLVDRHGNRLYALAYALLGNHADSEDVVQEMFIGAFERIGQFEGRSSVKTWLTRILVNQVARHQRREHRRRSMALPPDAILDPSAVTNVADTRMDVPTMLETLSPEHRHVIVLREIEGMNYQEIADTLNIPRGTVESRLFRAREALRKTFTEYLT